MAIKGYIHADTYVAIQNIFYEKDAKKITAHLTIYSDKNKKTVLGNTSVAINGSFLVPSIYSINLGLSSPPEDPSDCYYIIEKNASGPWYGCEGRLAKLSPLGTWDTYVLTNDSFLLYAEDDQKYYLYKDGSWEEYLDMTNDKRIWDKWFAPEVALANDTNPTKQMYKFMKTLSNFKDCEDA